MLPFYQNQYSELHCFDTDGINFPPHLHEPIELFYSVNGTAQIQTNRQQYLLSNGGLAIISPISCTPTKRRPADPIHSFLPSVRWR